MTWLLWLGLALYGLAVTVFGLVAYGSMRRTDTIRALNRKLESARIDNPT